ncbi:hypothetical protein [Streptomyces sp. CBMA123]|uniref:hypothetical protein n=1 Tax=Streptomyces sp. CBMA123 TaxID=1896313 RepID=UPI0016619D78|nr:hypothetical protein [Streptomyces sp. CBMA123]MBD0696156.1 hypothetical protein [Streptomyces sp. CBMA123]
MAGRHRRPQEPEFPADADRRLRAIVDQRPVVEEGVVLLPGSDQPYLYRTVYQPDGTVQRTLVRVDPGPPHGS